MVKLTIRKIKKYTPILIYHFICYTIKTLFIVIEIGEIFDSR
jgi:hypothetical protein